MSNFKHFWKKKFFGKKQTSTDESDHGVTLLGVNKRTSVSTEKDSDGGAKVMNELVAPPVSNGTNDSNAVIRASSVTERDPPPVPAEELSADMYDTVNVNRVPQITAQLNLGGNTQQSSRDSQEYAEVITEQAQGVTSSSTAAAERSDDDDDGDYDYANFSPFMTTPSADQDRGKIVSQYDPGYAVPETLGLVTPSSDTELGKPQTIVDSLDPDYDTITYSTDSSPSVPALTTDKSQSPAEGADDQDTYALVFKSKKPDTVKPKDPQDDDIYIVKPAPPVPGRGNLGEDDLSVMVENDLYQKSTNAAAHPPPRDAGKTDTQPDDSSPAPSTDNKAKEAKPDTGDYEDVVITRVTPTVSLGEDDPEHPGYLRVSVQPVPAN